MDPFYLNGLTGAKEITSQNILATASFAKFQLAQRDSRFGQVEQKDIYHEPKSKLAGRSLVFQQLQNMRAASTTRRTQACARDVGRRAVSPRCQAGMCGYPFRRSMRGAAYSLQ